MQKSISILMVALLATGMSLTAQNRGNGAPVNQGAKMGQPAMGMLKDLNLTEDQKAKLKVLHQGFAAQDSVSSDQMMKQREGIRAERELALAKILTPEQLAQLDKIRVEKGQKVGKQGQFGPGNGRQGFRRGGFGVGQGRGQMDQGRGQMAQGRGQMDQGRGQMMARGRGQKVQGRGQKVQGRGQMVQGRGQMMARGRGQMAQGRGQMAQGGQVRPMAAQMMNKRAQMLAGRGMQNGRMARFDRGPAFNKKNAKAFQGQANRMNKAPMVNPEVRIKNQVERMTKQLDLTPEQATQIQDIQTKNAKKEIATYQKLQKKHDAKFKERNAKFDEIKAVLTPEQVKKLDAVKEQAPKMQRIEGPMNGTMRGRK